MTRVPFSIGNNGPQLYDDEKFYEAKGGGSWTPLGGSEVFCRDTFPDHPQGGIVAEDGSRLGRLDETSAILDEIETSSGPDLSIYDDLLDEIEARIVIIEGMSFTDSTWTAPIVHNSQPISVDVDYYGNWLLPRNSTHTAMDVFRVGPYAGRALAATGRQILLQDAPYSSSFTEVGNVGTMTLDASSIKISPDGEWIVLMTHHDKAVLLLFSTATLMQTGSTVLWNNGDGYLANGSPGAGVDSAVAPLYDMAWMSNSRYFAATGGNWGIPASGVVLLDRTNLAGNMQSLLAAGDFLPGNSGGLAIDADDNLFLGLGLGSDRTAYGGIDASLHSGDIRAFAADEWRSIGVGEEVTPTQTITWATGRMVAQNVLSAAHVSLDHLGNLLAGGWNFYGGSRISDPAEQGGFTAAIHRKVIARVLGNPQGVQADRADGTEFRKFTPAALSPFSTAAGIMSGGRAASVVYNATATASDRDWRLNIVPHVSTYNPIKS